MNKSLRITVSIRYALYSYHLYTVNYKPLTFFVFYLYFKFGKIRMLHYTDGIKLHVFILTRTQNNHSGSIQSPQFHATKPLCGNHALLRIAITFPCDSPVVGFYAADENQVCTSKRRLEGKDHVHSMYF